MCVRQPKIKGGVVVSFIHKAIRSLQQWRGQKIQWYHNFVKKKSRAGVH